MTDNRGEGEGDAAADTHVVYIWAAGALRISLRLRGGRRGGVLRAIMHSTCAPKNETRARKGIAERVRRWIEILCAKTVMPSPPRRPPRRARPSIFPPIILLFDSTQIEVG